MPGPCILTHQQEFARVAQGLAARGWNLGWVPSKAMGWSWLQGDGLEPGLGSKRIGWVPRGLEPGLGSKGWVPRGWNLGWVPRGWAGTRAGFQGLGSQGLEPGLGS